MYSVIIPFLMFMLLGRTIDLKTYKIGGEIFDPDDYYETPVHQLNSTYIILEENTFPYTYVGLPADLVLRIKSNHLSSTSGSLGLDGLLRDPIWKSRSVILAVTSMSQTVIRSLKKNATTVSDWTQKIDRDQSHYVSSTVYGGWSVMLFRYMCNALEDRDIVRNILIKNLGQTGLMNQHTVDQWSDAHLKIKKNRELTGKIRVEVARYASVPLAQDLATPNKVLEAVHKFNKDVGELGHPIFVQLKPLNELDTRYPLIKENRQMDRELEMLNEQLDDLQQTKTEMRHWLSTTLAEFSEEEERLISATFDYVSNCIQMFDQIASEASVYNSMDISFLKSAMLIYEKGLKKQAPSYHMLFKRLKEDLDPQCTNNFGYKIKGVLKLPPDEQMHVGEMKGGLKECKAECVAEPKCRAIGYAEEYPVQELRRGELVSVFKYKQCWIYFRSSNTASVVPSKQEVTQVYNRNCY